MTLECRMIYKTSN